MKMKEFSDYFILLFYPQAFKHSHLKKKIKKK